MRGDKRKQRFHGVLILFVGLGLAACSGSISAPSRIQSTPWPYDDSHQLTTGEVIAASAGRNGQVYWSSHDNDQGDTAVEADVRRDDGQHPPEDLRFVWSINASTGHVSLVGFFENGKAQPVITLIAEALIWRMS